MDDRKREIEQLERILTEKKLKYEEDLKQMKPKRGRPKKTPNLDNVHMDQVKIREYPEKGALHYKYYVAKNDKRGRKVIWDEKRREIVKKIRDMTPEEVDELYSNLFN